MIRLFSALILFAAAFAPTLSAEEISIQTSDGVTLYGDIMLAGPGTDGPVLLLFHQARSNGRGEYGETHKRFLEAGFSTIIMDQRSGGDYFGARNRTVAQIGQNAGYCDAMPDLEATLAFAKEKGFSDVFVAGSSYSAGLVIRLAATHPTDISGVLAFSPASGGPMADCSPNDVAAMLDVPALVLRPEREMTNPSVIAQFDLFASQGHETFVAIGGVHGASMLDPARTSAPPTATWDKVFAFLQQHTD